MITHASQLMLPGREITLEMDAFCGKLIVVVPAGAHVIDEGGALFAKRPSTAAKTLTMLTGR